MDRIQRWYDDDDDANSYVVLLVGDGAVGKTCFQYIVSGRGFPNDYRSTGAKFRVLDFCTNAMVEMMGGPPAPTPSACGADDYWDRSAVRGALAAGSSAGNVPTVDVVVYIALCYDPKTITAISNLEKSVRNTWGDVPGVVLMTGNDSGDGKYKGSMPCVVGSMYKEHDGICVFNTLDIAIKLASSHRDIDLSAEPRKSKKKCVIM